MLGTASGIELMLNKCLLTMMSCERRQRRIAGLGLAACAGWKSVCKAAVACTGKASHRSVHVPLVRVRGCARVFPGRTKGRYTDASEVGPMPFS